MLQQFARLIVHRDRVPGGTPVKSCRPDDTRQPGLGIAHLLKILAILEHPQKTFLHGIFSVMVVAQYGISDAKDHQGMLSHQGFYGFQWRLSFAGLDILQNHLSDHDLSGHSAFL